MTYTMPANLTNDAASNIRNFRISNPGFYGKIAAKDQKVLFNGAAPFGKKTVWLVEPGVIEVRSSSSFTGDELTKVRVSETGRVFYVAGDSWGRNQNVPSEGTWMWQVGG